MDSITSTKQTDENNNQTNKVMEGSDKSTTTLNSEASTSDIKNTDSKDLSTTSASNNDPSKTSSSKTSTMNANSQSWRNPNTVVKQQKKEKKKDSADSLVDSVSWPTLQQAQVSPDVNKKENESNIKSESSESINNSENNSTESTNDENSAKKKGINWVPLKDVTPGPTNYRITLAAMHANNASSSTTTSTSTSTQTSKDSPREKEYNSSIRGSSYRGRGISNGIPRREYDYRRGDTTKEPSNGEIKEGEDPNVPSREYNKSDRSYDRSEGRGGYRGDRDRSSYRGSSRRGRGSSISYTGNGNGNGNGSGSGSGRGTPQYNGVNIISGVVPPHYIQSYIPVVILEGDQLKEALLKQIEYYFSVENLCKDLFLRKQMDEEGYVPLSIITNFNRIRQLSVDIDLITEVLADSKIVELKGKNKIRKLGDWKIWIFPKTEDTSNATTSASSSTSASTPNSTNTTTNTNANSNKPERESYSKKLENNKKSIPNSNEKKIEQVKKVNTTATTTTNTSKTQPVKKTEAPIKQTTNSTTTPPTTTSTKKEEIVKPKSEEEWQNVTNKRKSKKPEKKYHPREDRNKDSKEKTKERDSAREKSNATTTTTTQPQTQTQQNQSNGNVVHTLSNKLLEDLEKNDVDDTYISKLVLIIPNSTSTDNNESFPNYDEFNNLMNQGSLFYEKNNLKSDYKEEDNKRFYLPKNKTQDNTSTLSTITSSIGWMIDSTTPESKKSFSTFEHTASKIINENYTLQSYQNFRNQSVDDRKLGNFESSNLLYRFYSQFLVKHYNKELYTHFRNLALEDAKENRRKGLNSLYKFYVNSLENKVRPNLYDEFRESAIHDYNQKQIFGLQKLWEFLRNRKDKSKLERSTELIKLLDKFKSTHDFKNYPDTEFQTIKESSSLSNPWFKKRNFK